MLEIVAGVGDDDQPARRQYAIEAERQLGAADAARQREDAARRGRHRNRSCSAGRTKAAAGTSGADHDSPRTRTIGTPSFAWPMSEPRGGCDLVGKAGLGHLQWSSEEIGMSAQIDKRRQPGGAEGDADRPFAPRPAKAVADDDGKRHAKGRDQSLAQRPRRPVRVERQQQHPLGGIIGRDVRMIDTGIGHDETEPVLDDQQPRAAAHHPPQFGQHHLDKARVLVDLGGECHGRGRGPHRRDVDIPPLGFRDDLLRHHQHVAVCRRQPVGRERGDGDRAEIVARFDELDAGERLELDRADHQPSLARSSGTTRSA